ncbi:hypothetical protein [Streptomyces roseicoloratus]|uniref:hypothetical protein n=1 Tax=Streptomyces roseicoloratus TaxID=2508722 RepID=UPI001009F84F|nr:hypothetical protein [Streptomyces roseicoloratus]
MIFGRGRFTAAVADFGSAVRAHDAEAAEKAFGALQSTFDGADDAELHEAAPRLAALLPDVPPGPRAVVAVVVGACVERGADPVACAPAVFAAVREAFETAGDFARRWTAEGRGELPGHDGEGLTEEDVERFGYGAVAAWQSLEPFEMAGVAMLGSPAVRRGVPGRPELLAAVRNAAEAADDRFRFKRLEYALAVLDDEPIVAIDRVSGAGFALRASGIGDNFQLHTLLAHALIGGGHLPGDAPSAEAVARCRDEAGLVPTTGSFNLVGADGEWIWNEGNPSDIPVVGGVRLLVLDPPPYARSWDAGRFFPRMAGDLVLERVLAPEESAALLAQVADPVR